MDSQRMDSQRWILKDGFSKVDSQRWILKGGFSRWILKADSQCGFSRWILEDWILKNLIFGHPSLGNPGFEGLEITSAFNE